MRARLLIAAALPLTVSGTDAASAFITANTIDRHATYDRDGARVRATGPIGCTRGERVSISVTVTQAATGERARDGWTRPTCTSPRPTPTSKRRRSTPAT